MSLISKIEHLIISSESSILDALKKMDENDCKLLIVFKKDTFLSLVSIGDLQRSLLKENNFKKQIFSLLREKINFASTSQSHESIKKLMLKYRTELMPILDDNNNLTDVIFWKDVFLEQQQHNKIEENIPVVIMAGGTGNRLKPITNIIPKPLVPVGERPFAQIIMDSFKDYGINNFHFSVNYKADLIKYYFDSIDKDYQISYYKEEKPLGTAGSLHLMKDAIGTTFFVSNCDILINDDYSEIYKYHKENNNELTAVAAVKTYSIPYGTMEIESNGVLKSLTEKPNLTYYVNAGLYILEPHLLDEIPQNELFHITHLMEKIKHRKGKVGVFPVSEGSWLDIGVWDQYQKTQDIFNKRFDK